MSSLIRFVLSLMVAALSLCTFSAFAQTADTSMQPAATTTPTTVTATTKTTMHHVKMKHKLVDLNAADAKTLAKIKGIGKKKAAMIIVYRNKNGNFSSVDDLKNLKTAKGKAVFTPKAIIVLKKRVMVSGS